MKNISFYTKMLLIFILLILFSEVTAQTPVEYFEMEPNNLPNDISTQWVIDPQVLLHSSSNQDDDIWLLDGSTFENELFIKKISGKASVKIYESPNADFSNAGVFTTVSSTYHSETLDPSKYYYIHISGGSPDGNIVQIGNDDFVPVPVRLTKFSAKLSGKNKVILQWTTASEIANDYFQIEHSVNGHHFANLGKVQGNGNSSLENHYQFTHQSPNSAINYYRLKQVDFDRSYTYSNVIIQRILFHKKSVSIYPNPIKGGALNLILHNKAINRYDIMDTRGVFLAQNIAFEKDSSIDISFLGSGFYLVRFYQKESNTYHIEKIQVVRD